MTAPFATPMELVQALQAREDAVRAQFQDWLREPVETLMHRLTTRHQLDHDFDQLTKHALHSAETYLRTQDPQAFADLSLRALRATLLLYLAKQAHQPFGQQVSNGYLPDPLPESDDYWFQTLFLPYEKVGSFWYGGDWYGGRREEDGTLWLIVADITGHGYFAYLLASTLPRMWDRCWDENQPVGAEPFQVMERMHELICDCLPEGIFVECTLIRLRPDGETIVAAAGGSRLLLLNAEKQEVHLHKLRGLWLGLDAPTQDDQHLFQLEDGDELLVASDGLYDQLREHAGEKELLELLEAPSEDGTLLDGVGKILREVLDEHPQQDDITTVLIRRQQRRTKVTVGMKVQ